MSACAHSPPSSRLGWVELVLDVERPTMMDPLCLQLDGPPLVVVEYVQTPSALSHMCKYSFFKNCGAVVSQTLHSDVQG
ncbi:hypothetical protein JZ751_025327 [Albula glossodonta]|uniref:Uncharacterized protein n=1 Tax=Albula glossodonta TaxID=121402 RepID=A0A8T2NRB4_9TELE|nr:hypothetical protein JZ751_025327 [Albula glossodonta]